jgi:3-oxoacyl-[acyl-carrier-protein] synthase II
LKQTSGIMSMRDGQSNPATRNRASNSPGPVQVVDAAIITALGEDLQTSWRKISTGATGIRPLTRFPTDAFSSHIAAYIEGLKPARGSSMTHPLLDRLFKELGPIPPDAFPITATTKAGIDNLERLQRGNRAEPRDISLYSIMDMVVERFGLQERGINISAACASSTIALARGAALIALGRAEAVLVCCADLVTEFIFSGFSALKALSPVPCKPFDVERQGLSLGEGAAALLLMSRERALRDRRSPLGMIHGWGAANDGVHITAPARSGRGLVQAVSHALHMGEIKAEQISAISAHGTGTIYNDHMELTAFRRIFGERKVPIYSVKGAIGHSLGAAGGIEVTFGLKTLSEKTAPPTVGLVNPMDGARGLVSPEPASIGGDYLLTTNSGFGGINAALILGR